MVALTYDDGPGGKKVKKRYLIVSKAAIRWLLFFYTGNRVDNAPDKIDRARVWDVK